jgi:hypothetical protein
MADFQIDFHNKSEMGVPLSFQTEHFMEGLDWLPLETFMYLSTMQSSRVQRTMDIGGDVQNCKGKGELPTS